MKWNHDWDDEFKEAQVILRLIYSGIEKYQRDEVYRQARKSGLDHLEAMEKAHSEENLPSFVFEVDRTELIP